MKTKTIFLSDGAIKIPNRENETPIKNIPGISLPKIETHDDICDADFQKRVWDYIQDQIWHVAWDGLPSEIKVFKPSDWDDSWANGAIQRRGLLIQRCMFGSDEPSIKRKHPIIHELWLRINERLGNRYEITGVPEGVWWKDFPVPPCEDPNLPTGWRIYANSTGPDNMSGCGYIHRDTSDLSNPYTVTMIYCAVQEWYPSWGNEIIFYPEDHDGITGDHQQFDGGQHRGFQIGWPDEGKLVSLRPNRLLVYDGRTLHSTNPSRNRHVSIANRRVVFRAALRPEFRS